MDTIASMAFQAHARAEFPRECCGILLVVKGKERYLRCRNISASSVHFILHPEDYAAAEDLGEVIGICHSHPNLAAIPSEADLAGCESSGIEWHILNVHSEGCGALHSFRPSGYVAPLLGVPFVHGVHDCYSLIRRYYQQELEIMLPDYDRDERWWDKGHNLYLENFAEAGFVQVDELQPHDVILMKLASPVPNHAAVYVGNNQIVQHVMNRLSSRDVWGGWYQKISTHYLRHKMLIAIKL
jgi:proteasome lid subunit RPN8/RPN11